VLGALTVCALESDVERIYAAIRVALEKKGTPISAHDMLIAAHPRAIEAEGQAWRVVSFGQNGDTTADGLARLDDLLAEQPDILVLALGANDGIRGVPLDTIRQNLDAIITRAQAAGVRVLLCGMEAPPLHGLRYSLAFHFVFPDLAQHTMCRWCLFFSRA
jgi:hypothetical protein